MRAAGALVLAVATGCPAAKPDLDLPTPTGGLQATLEVPALADPPRDIRALRVAGSRLYVGEARGLVIYAIDDPRTPVELGRIAGPAVDDLAIDGDVVILVQIDADAQLRTFDVSAPAAPRPIAAVAAATHTFGGVAVAPGLIWHAVGSNPPSRLYRGVELTASCAAPDRERGAMGVWLDGTRAIESVHFDDYAGDDLDGNGAFGFVAYALELPATGCPRVHPTDIYFAATHDQNRSAFERPSASDLQLAPGAGGYFVTGEQRVRHLALDDGRFRVLDEVVVPDAIALAADDAGPCGTVVGVAHGDVAVLCSDGGLSVAAAVATPGVVREVAAAGDGRHLYVADDELGLAVVRYEVP